LPEEINIRQKITERDDIADILGLIPQWFIGALLWITISELVLKRLYPDDFIKLQTAILGADIVGEMPPGVAMVAVLYNTLYLVEVKEELTGAFLDELVKPANKIILTIAKFTGI